MQLGFFKLSSRDAKKTKGESETGKSKTEKRKSRCNFQQTDSFSHFRFFKFRGIYFWMPPKKKNCENIYTAYI